MYVIGVDLGQKRDHTAIVMVEKPYRHPLASVVDPTLTVRMAQRLPLGMGYPEMVEVVRHVVGMGMRAGYVRGQTPCAVVVDATGVGTPVVEAMRAAGLGAEVTSVTITGGAAETHKGLDYHVPKQDLMMGLQLLLEKGELKISRKGSEAGALVKELVNMRQQTGVRGRIRVGAEAFGEHDDLVMALALVAWKAKRIFVMNGMVRLPGI